MTRLLTSLGLLALMLAMTPLCLAAQEFDLDRFIAPETCAGCHTEIADQWAGSMHNLSHKDPVYNRVAKFLREGLTDAGEIEEAESCVKCHTPVGFVSGFPKKVSDDLTRTGEVPAQGIQCDYCHVAVDLKQMYNNGLVLAPGKGEDDPGVKQGPFDDAEPDFHEARYSELHTDSKFCGTCHNVKHLAFGTDLETTYTEWANSPYNRPGTDAHVSCQGCHMFQRPGIPATGKTDRPANPGSATDYSKERPHIFTHYFVGGNSGVTRSQGFDDKAAMAEARLAQAADLELDLPEAGSRTLKVRVTNSGAGHALPTGVGDLRQVWLEVVLTHADGTQAFASGLLDSRNELGSDTVIFNTVFGDGKGNPVWNIAKARQILSDTRIPAKATVEKTFDLGQEIRPGQTLTVRLLYRGMDQKILNQLPGEPLGPLPVVEMARADNSF